MQELITNITSPAWWFTAVAVALFINLASTYIKPWLDVRMSRFSEAWRNRSAQAQERYRRAVALAAKSPYAFQAIVRREVRYRLTAIAHVLLAILFLLLRTPEYPNIPEQFAIVRYSLEWFVGVLIRVFPLLVILIAVIMWKGANELNSIIEAASKLLAKGEHEQ